LIAPLAWLFPGKPAGSIELGASALIALWCSGIFAYLWLRRSCGAAGATLGALIYLINPYHVTVDLYMRATLTEFWTFAWMPLVLYFIEGTVRRRRYALVGLAVSYALLVTTHLLITLIFSPIAVAYALLLSKRGERLSDLVRVNAGLLLGIGLTALFLFMALDEQRYMFSEAYLADPTYQWRNNFPPLDARLLQRNGAWPDFGQFLAILTILSGVGLACVAPTAKRGPTAFWLAIAGGSLFMTTSLSAPIWRFAPAVEKLAFPWRFQIIFAVAIAALAAQSWGNGWPSRRIALGGSVCVALLWLTFFGRMFYIVSIQDHQVGWAAEFTGDPSMAFWSSPGAKETMTEQVRFESGAGTAAIEKWSPGDIRVRLRCDRESRLVFHQFFYRRWKADTPFRVEASEDGLVRVVAPAGENELHLWLDGGAAETAGKWVSAMSFAILLLLALRERRRADGTERQLRGLAPGELGRLNRA
jgi:hypothetical protein